jgi:hypothetical protein
MVYIKNILTMKILKDSYDIPFIYTSPKPYPASSLVRQIQEQGPA